MLSVRRNEGAPSLELTRLLNNRRANVEAQMAGNASLQAQILMEQRRNEERRRALEEQLATEKARNPSQRAMRVTVKFSDSTKNDPEKLYQVANELFGGVNRQKNVWAALGLYERAIGQGSIDAHFTLGEIYTEGRELEKNSTKGREHFRCAASRGHLQAMVVLAESPDLINSLEGKMWLKRAAFRGAPSTLATFQHKYGSDNLRLFALAQELESVYSQDAADCFERAGEQGYGEGYLELGRLYEEGKIQPRNDLSLQLSAVEAYCSALTKGTFPPIIAFTRNLSSREELHRYGDRILTSYPAASFSCYEKADDGDGYKKMAQMYASGIGVSKSIDNSYIYYEKASEAHKKAYSTEICALTDDASKLVEFGRRSKQPETSFACYRKAQAWREMAECYARGYGIEKNIWKAFECYTKVVESGLPLEASAITALSEDPVTLIQFGDQFPDKKISFKCYEKAKADLKLAECYHLGRGVEKNVLHAFSHYLAAMRAGHTVSCETITSLSADGEVLRDLGLRAEAAGLIDLADSCFIKGNQGSYFLQLASRRPCLDLQTACCNYLKARKYGVAVDPSTILSLANNYNPSLATIKGLAMTDRYRQLDVANSCQAQIDWNNRPPPPAPSGRRRRRRWYQIF